MTFPGGLGVDFVSELKAEIVGSTGRTSGTSWTSEIAKMT